MPQVKYIAAGIKTDSIRGVGLRWEPGQVRTVTAEVAELLLFYTDTWEKVQGEDAGTQPIGLMKDENPTEEPLPVVDFHALTKDQMVEYAARNYNEKLDKRQSVDTLRIKLVGLFTQHHMDVEGNK